MYNSTHKEISCGKCGKTTVFKVWNHINVAESPELKEKVLDMEINHFVCPDCGSQICKSQSFIYNDPLNEFAVIYVPLDKGESFNSLMGYIELPYDNLRISYEYCNLSEKIRIFENNLNDKAVELLKTTAIMLSSELQPKHIRVLFLGVYEEEIYLSHINVIKPDEKFDIITMTFDEYNRILSDEDFDISNIKDKWHIVDSIYAVGQLYGQDFKEKLIGNLEREYRMQLKHLWA